ncbi:MAG TPA: hypothetical protein VKY26_03200 [Actinomycetota bacterium]|nr:hypothetical protein [Actinomycetota bacterium]
MRSGRRGLIWGAAATGVVAVAVVAVAARHGAPRPPAAGAAGAHNPGIAPPPPAAFVDTADVATSFAGQLLDATGVPPGSAVSALPPPQGLAGPVERFFGAIDSSRLWTTPLAPAEALSYAEAHLPQGAQLARRQTPTSALITVTAPPAGVPEAEMTVQAVAAPGGSVLRADAMVAWYPARSAGEPVPATDTVVAITRTPSSPGPPAPGLDSITLTEAAGVAQVANLVNGLPTVTSPAPECSLLFKTTYTVSFARSASATPDLVAAEGCSSIAVSVGGTAAEPLTGAASFDTTLAPYFAGAPAGSHPAWPAPVPPRFVSSKPEAEALLSRLQSSLVPPPGATARDGNPPPALANPATEIGPGAAISAQRLWTVPGSPEATIAFLRAHLVTGAVPGDSGGPGERLWFDEDVTGTAIGGDVTPEVVAGPGDTSILRVDFEVTYDPARSMGEEVPASDHYLSISRTPEVAPTPSPPVTATFSDPATVLGMANLLNALPAAGGDGTASCPAPVATYTIAFSRSPTAPPDFVVTGPGCLIWSVTQGRTARQPLSWSDNLDRLLSVLVG